MSKPVPFHGKICDECTVVDEFAPEVRVLIHLIKQAVDDYIFEKICTIRNKKMRARVHNDYVTALKFIYSNDIKIVLEVMGFGDTVDIPSLRKHIEKHDVRRINWLHKRT